MFLSFTATAYRMFKAVSEIAFVACMLLIALSPLNWLLGLHEPHIFYYLLLTAKICGAGCACAFLTFLVNRFVAMIKY